LSTPGKDLHFGDGTKEKQMNPKRFILAGCALMIMGAGPALAGPCDTTGRSANMKDAGSGPTPGNTGQTIGANTNVDQHPPTDTMNRATGDVATFFTGCAEADAR